MPAVSEILADLRGAGRTVRRDPWFYGSLILLLALPIGALVLAAAAVRGMLLTPPPYDRPHDLVLVSNRFGLGRQAPSAASAPELLDYRERLGSLASLAAVNSFDAALTGDGSGAEQLTVGVTSGNFFETLGVRALHGRIYTATDDTPLDTRDSANSSILILSHELWQRRYGSDPSVVGRLVRLGGTRMRVIGVLPAGFRLRLPPGGMSTALHAWTPLRIDYANAPRDGRYLTLIGRLADGRHLSQLAVEAAAVSRDLRLRFSQYERGGLAIAVESLHGASVSHLRPIMLLLVAAVGTVLILACISAAGMLLARLMKRGHDFAVRSALGAGTGRLLRQLAAEIGLAAALATALGIAVGAAFLQLLSETSVHPDIESLALTLDPAFAIGCLAMFVAIGGALGGLGAMPALRASGVLAGPGAAQRGLTASHRGWRRWRGGLVAAEVALSLVLVVGAGLLLRSSLEVRALSLGFEPASVMTFRVSLPFARYRDPARWEQQYETLLGELAGVPGVEAAGAADLLPASGGSALAPYATVPTTEAEWGATSAAYRTVSTGYFAALGIAVLGGRGFTADDRAGGHRVVIVDEALARRTWRHSPLGERLQVQVEDFTGGYRVERAEAEVVGVVATVAHDRPDLPAGGTIYLPMKQQPVWSAAFAVRTRVPPEAVMAQVRGILRRLDPDLPAYEARPMAEIVRSTFALTDLALSLVAAFALLALIVAAAGLYGLIGYIVRATSREEAIRMACGASPGRLLRAHLRTGLALAGAGVAVGALLTVPAAWVVEDLLVGVRATDPVTLGVAAAFVLAVAALSTLGAALRVLRTEPGQLLRSS
jgi:putative ABC transport system permease protein